MKGDVELGHCCELEDVARFGWIMGLRCCDAKIKREMSYRELLSFLTLKHVQT